MKTLKLALDWTPNINHIGFFIAQEKGLFKDQNLEVEIMDPSTDNYSITPAKKVEMGLSDFALCPTESVISYRTKSKPFELIAIAAILQEDLSAIAVKDNDIISSPRDLDGKKYASYQARYEDEIVKQMIRNDSGSGNIVVAYPEKLGIWDTVVNGSFDATWIFLNWEAVEAEALGLSLKCFKMKDYNIPYSYSPVIAANQNLIAENVDHYTRFLEATKQGYLFAQQNPDESIAILKAFIPESDLKIDLRKALEMSSAYFGNEADWGLMNPDTLGDFLKWIYDHNLETTRLEPSDIMTNGLIQSV